MYNGVIGGEGGLPSVIPHLDVKNGEIVYCSDRHTYSTYLEHVLKKDNDAVLCNMHTKQRIKLHLTFTAGLACH